jgi:hypothetical protein
LTALLLAIAPSSSPLNLYSALVTDLSSPMNLSFITFWMSLMFWNITAALSLNSLSLCLLSFYTTKQLVNIIVFPYQLLMMCTSSLLLFLSLLLIEIDLILPNEVCS